MTSSIKHIELIFPANADPGDLTILAAATYDEPGRARLGAARIELASGNGSRVYSANGGAFIGVIGYGDPWWPYETAYWLEEVEAEAAPPDAYFDALHEMDGDYGREMARRKGATS